MFLIFISGPKAFQLDAEQYTKEYIGRGNRICNPPVGSTSTFDRRSSDSDRDDENPTSAELVSKLFVT